MVTTYSTLESQKEGLLLLERELKGHRRPIVGVRELGGGRLLTPFLSLGLTELSFDSTGLAQVLPTTVFQVPPPFCMALNEASEKDFSSAEARLGKVRNLGNTPEVLFSVLTQMGFHTPNTPSTPKTLRGLFDLILSRQIQYRGLPSELSVYLFDRASLDQLLWELDSTDKALQPKKGLVNSLWSRATQGDH